MYQLKKNGPRSAAEPVGESAVLGQLAIEPVKADTQYDRWVFRKQRLVGSPEIDANNAVTRSTASGVVYHIDG